jgi:hypothetical protein
MGTKAAKRRDPKASLKKKHRKRDFKFQRRKSKATAETHTTTKPHRRMAIQREENPQRARKPKAAKAENHDTTMTGREHPILNHPPSPKPRA